MLFVWFGLDLFLLRQAVLTVQCRLVETSRSFSLGSQIVGYRCVPTYLAQGVTFRNM